MALLSFSKEKPTPAYWAFEEPLFFNPALPTVSGFWHPKGQPPRACLPILGSFSGLTKRTPYCACTKTLNFQALMDLRGTKWTEVMGSGSSPKGSWRSLYKRPIEKRMGDLQWRLVHGILATNRHVARLDPLVGEGCPFCGVTETVFHLFPQCSHLCQLLHAVRNWA